MKVDKTYVAMCVWEAFLDETVMSDETRRQIKVIREELGTQELRQWACRVTWQIGLVLEHLSQEKVNYCWDSFDWDFVPWLVDKIITELPETGRLLAATNKYINECLGEDAALFE